MALHNKVDRRVLKEQMEKSPARRTTFSFYRYFSIAEPEEFRDKLYQFFDKWLIFGRVYVAKEGINGQVSIPSESLASFRQNFYTEYPKLNGVRLNIALDDDGKSFYKLKIKVRKKIVADGLAEGSFDVFNKGTYLNAEEFNDLTERPGTVVVDMRNHYESEVGHFESAVLPDVDTFREALPHVVELLSDKKGQPVIMYCTGGIRCEKASAYMKHHGFQDVYQLDGGIIEYGRQVKEKGLENKFLGKNFVFDERLGERISEKIIANCHQCGAPCDTHVNCRNEACNLLFIQCESCAEKMEGCCSAECKSFVQLPLELQKEQRKGIKNPARYYKKGRFELSNKSSSPALE
ncbi:MAG: rhodanese-related sulfurtransferase [Bacteroidota bacterium]